MKYYITYPINEPSTATDYSIIKVREVDEANFLEDYGVRVIASGNSLMEALLNFEQVKSGQ
ncbi:hypothetical protein [Terrimonas sp.]|uniref:hypothetical protein n=1 Tax=Terrimonas sp. TaxID=1914338 RepID=UPI0010574972|nr:hypothetical protein [Terrimonas sp.]